jgi:hypothetical protein
MLYDDRGSTAQRLARELAIAVLESAATAAALAAATTGGTAAYRRVPARHGHYIRLAAAIAAAFTAGAITDGLLDLPGSRLRHRLNGFEHSTPTCTPPAVTAPAQSEPAPSIEQAEATPELTDADVLRRLEDTVAADAAIRAASHGWCRAIGEKLLTSSKHWQGHPDGTASLPLVAGCTLRFEPHTCAEIDADPGDWRHGPFVLDDNGARAEVVTPAELLAHLNGGISLFEVDPHGDLPCCQLESADVTGDSNGA